MNWKNITRRIITKLLTVIFMEKVQRIFTFYVSNVHGSIYSTCNQEKNVGFSISML